MLWLLGFKIVAYWLGPSGVGLFSQLRQVVQAATIAATFGGTNSVVQGISERPDEQARLNFRATAGRLVAAAGLIVSSSMVVFAADVAHFFFSSTSEDLTVAVRWAGFAVLLNAVGTYTLGVLNGYRSFHLLALGQVVGPAALVMFLGSVFWQGVAPQPQLLGIAFVLCFGATLAAGAWGMWRLWPVGASHASQGLPASETRSFLRFAASNLGAALATTLTFLLIRTWIIDARGLDFAGLFDAGWTLTFNYATLFLTACSSIYLPLLTRASGLDEQANCIRKTAYLVLAGATLACYALVFLAGPIVRTLYSPAFQPSEQVLSILVIAVVFRSVSWVYGALIVATRKSRVLIVSDVAFNAGLLIAIKYSLNYHASLASVAWGFVLLNFCYLIFAVEYVKQSNKQVLRRNIWPLLVWSAGPLVFLSIANQSHSDFSGWLRWTCFVLGMTAALKSLLDFRKTSL